MSWRAIRCSTLLEVVSGRPSGSCTQFNGYEVVRRNDNTINVEITHHQIVDPQARCTRDYPIEETIVPLGVLEEGVEYTVTVNGAHEQTVVGVGRPGLRWKLFRGGGVSRRSFPRYAFGGQPARAALGVTVASQWAVFRTRHPRGC